MKHWRTCDKPGSRTEDGWFFWLVDYCQYGSVLHKRTAIWCNVNLEDWGADFKQCPGNCCQSCIYSKNVKTLSGAKTVHFDIEKISSNERIVIPDALSAQFAYAILHSLLNVKPVGDMTPTVQEQVEDIKFQMVEAMKSRDSIEERLELLTLLQLFLNAQKLKLGAVL